MEMLLLVAVFFLPFFVSMNNLGTETDVKCLSLCVLVFSLAYIICPVVKS